jgi:hypothetical protein
MRPVRPAAGIGLANGRPAYRCRHGHTSAARPSPGRPKNTYVCEDQILPHLAALAILLAADSTAGDACAVRITAPDGTADLIDRLRASGTVLTYDPDTRTLRAHGHDYVAVTVG